MISRTIFKTAIFLSAGTESKIASNSVFSSTTSAAAPGAAIIIMPPAAGAALTPKASSICLTNSEASNKVRDFNCSKIVSVAADMDITPKEFLICLG